MKAIIVALGVLVLVAGGIALERHFAVRHLRSELSALRSKDIGRLREVDHLRRMQSERSGATAGNTSEVSQAMQPPAFPYDGPLGNLKLLAEATARGIVPKIYFSPLTGSFDHLSDTFIKAFSLTPQEVSTLKRHMVDAKTKMESLIASCATATRASDGSLVITVAPTPDGGSVHDSLLAAYRQTLGEERYQYFLQIFDNQFEQGFGYFGAQERRVTIKRNTTSAEFTVEDRRKAVAGRGGVGHLGFTHSMPVTNRQELEEKFRVFAHLFPPDL